MTKPLLTAYWIKTGERWGPLGYGVTARSLNDAFRIVRGWGFELPADPPALSIREGVTIAELDEPHVVANMGPIVVRGVWYPFVGLGVPPWMDA